MNAAILTQTMDKRRPGVSLPHSLPHAAYGSGVDSASETGEPTLRYGAKG
jgi:hypothetical protein